MPFFFSGGDIVITNVRPPIYAPEMQESHQSRFLLEDVADSSVIC
jgi:hypothetical protein